MSKNVNRDQCHWDIYRTSLPLITILDPLRERDIVNSLLNIYKRDDYMPDGLPGNDDSGAMSSRLAFHMMGIYPNAGQSYYL